MVQEIRDRGWGGDGDVGTGMGWRMGEYSAMKITYTPTTSRGRQEEREVCAYRVHSHNNARTVRTGTYGLDPRKQII